MTHNTSTAGPYKLAGANIAHDKEQFKAVSLLLTNCTPNFFFSNGPIKTKLSTHRLINYTNVKGQSLLLGMA